jgi:hypothetical protein
VEGTRRVKRRKAAGVWIACEPLIRAHQSQPSERCIQDSGPPPPLKGRKAGGGGGGGGSGIASRAVDPGAMIVAVGEMRPVIPDPPPPPLKGRKAGGLRNPMHAVDLGARMSAVQICLLFTTVIFASRT